MQIERDSGYRAYWVSACEGAFGGQAEEPALGDLSGARLDWVMLTDHLLRQLDRARYPWRTSPWSWFWHDCKARLRHSIFQWKVRWYKKTIRHWHQPRLFGDSAAYIVAYSEWLASGIGGSHGMS